MIKRTLVFVQLFFLIGMLSAQDYDFVVAADGSGDFTKVQDAIDAVPDLRKKETLIFIKNGVYKEKLVLAGSKTNITFVGEDVEKTLLTYDDYASKHNRFGEEVGTSGSSSFFIYGDGFTARNITFENSSGPVGQAVAVRVDGDKVFFENCRFLGYQDTLYPHGKDSRQYYKDCYVEGTVDFIFGWSTVIFEGCQIHSLGESGYVTAASTTEETDYGFVFIDCKLTSDTPKHSVYLGRPWRPYAQTVFINCEMDDHIKPEGWHNWGKEDAEKTTFYAEYGSTGPGASPGTRVSWAKELKEKELINYTKQKVFGDWDPGH